MQKQNKVTIATYNTFFNTKWNLKQENNVKDKEIEVLKSKIQREEKCTTDQLITIESMADKNINLDNKLWIIKQRIRNIDCWLDISFGKFDITPDLMYIMSFYDPLHEELIKIETDGSEIKTKINKLIWYNQYIRFRDERFWPSRNEILSAIDSLLYHLYHKM